MRIDRDATNASGAKTITLGSHKRAIREENITLCARQFDISGVSASDRIRFNNHNSISLKIAAGLQYDIACVAGT